MLPSGGWKKHGRAVPSASITVDTQGALHLGGAGSHWPPWARKWRAIRRSLSGDSAMKPDSKYRSYLRVYRFKQNAEYHLALRQVLKQLRNEGSVVHDDGRMLVLDITASAPGSPTG